MLQDCSSPCEKCEPNTFRCANATLQAKLETYDLCDMCGLDGNDIKMARCQCCEEQGKETVACYSCIPQQMLRWLIVDEDQRHWRCRRCRSVRQSFLFKSVKFNDSSNKS